MGTARDWDDGWRNQFSMVEPFSPEHLFLPEGSAKLEETDKRPEHDL
jgi:hypothetical protein